ncbi:MAG: HAD family hydrolase [Bacteriovorax sp.]
MSLTQLNKYKIVFSDFDGTLTYKEGLGPVFFDILNHLEAKKVPLVIVTGRSLSWGHFLLTHFPFLTDVIVEGGGAIVSRSGKFITEECMVSEVDVRRLANFALEFSRSFPNIKLSVDSFGRKTDRAIELHDLQDGVLFHHIEDFLRDHNINFSTSNVHLNFWCGEVSKYIAVEHFLKKHSVVQADCVFFGDSLNDQAMFKSFENSVGVANISTILDQLIHRPTTILTGDENIGPYGVLNYLKLHL